MGQHPFDDHEDHLLEVDDELMDVEHDVVHGYSNTWGRGLDRETIKTRLLQREYQVEIVLWFSRAYQLYKHHWQILTLWGFIYAVLSFAVPFVGGILSVFWYAGLIAVGCDLIRTTNPSLHISFMDLIPSFFVAMPIYLIFFLKLVSVSLGLLLFVVPGIYLAVTLQMAIPLYVEFHRDEMTMIDALSISRALVHKRFFKMALFLLAVLFGGLSGVILLGVGLFATLPIATLAVCIALSDIFGLRDTHLYAVGASVVGDDFATD